MLHHKTFGQGPALIVLHGLFGSLDNWVTHARVWEKDYSVFLIDQRNHGKSPHRESFNYPDMAKDLYEWMEENGIYRAHLLGHSMGGKTVMQFAGDYPDHVDKLIVADMAPKAYPPHHEAVLRALRLMDLAQLESRKAAENFLMENLNQDVSTTQFLLKGLGRDEQNRFVWKFNLPTILENYERILDAVTPEPFFGETLFLSGGASHYVEESDHQLILTYFPNAEFQVMEGIGHWLHAEAPADFIGRVSAFLK